MSTQPADSNDGDTSAGPRDSFYTSTDGLRLHVVEYGDARSPWLPVVCLPGLSRTARDFQPLARHLSQHRHRPRHVVAFDYRGRGGSEWDSDSAHYNPLTEMADVLDGLTALGLDRAVFVGTSRGGIISMLIGVGRPNAIAGLVLNDVGPVIEPLGLARIKTYIGRTPAPDDWDDAATILRRLHGGHFPGLDDDDWAIFARMTYRDAGGLPAGDYDPALAKTFEGVELDQPMPNLWNEFNTLKDTPMLAIRGEHSDLLSEATLAAMAAAHPGLESMTINGQGHPPLLVSTPILQRISSFITALEGSGPPVDAIIPRDADAFSLDARPAPESD